MSSEFTHIDASGNANMVDVSAKEVTSRVGVAQAVVTMLPATLKMIVAGEHKKGDVLGVAQIAGIQAAKKCSDLIPLCHPLMLSSVKVELTPDEATHQVIITATCKIAGQTGVEMEALTAATVASLTLYDMCKSVDKGMTISDVKLLHKAGGKSGEWNASDD